MTCGLTTTSTGLSAAGQEQERCQGSATALASTDYKNKNKNEKPTQTRPTNSLVDNLRHGFRGGGALLPGREIADGWNLRLLQVVQRPPFAWRLPRGSESASANNNRNMDK
jgi:hypothetical protein